MNLARKIFIGIFLVGIVVIGGWFVIVEKPEVIDEGSKALYCGLQIDQSVLWTDKILSGLPEKARLAEIPILFNPDHTVKQKGCNIIFADVNGDGEDEIMVAYYTLPHEYLTADEDDESFFRRAHVRIFEWNKARLLEQWDSGGWGFVFRARMDPKIEEDNQLSHTTNFFDARDINSDGKPEILFTRGSFLAEGDQFEVWTWDGRAYKQIALVDSKVRIDDLDNDGIQEIISDYDYKGIKLASPIIFRWDGEFYRIKPRK